MDNRGVIGFPARIGLAVLLISLCVPVLTEVADGFRSETELRQMNEETEKMLTCASTAYYGGAGTSAVTEISTLPGYSIEIGGAGGNGYSVSVKCGDSTVSRQFADSPPILFLNNAEFSGTCTLKFTCVDEGTYGVKVEQL